MEKKLGIIFFFFVLLLQLPEFRTAQRPSQMDKEEEKGIDNNNWAWAVAQADKTSDMAQELSHLMGEEKCEESDDEECMKRRMMITDTHLDYIYTQSHSKP